MGDARKIDTAELALGVQSLGLGVAIVDPNTWNVIFENTKFGQWFPATEGASLDKRMTDLPMDRATARLSQGRKFTFQTVSKTSGRETPVAVDMSALNSDKNPSFLIECRDISKEKQTEYMLESYSKMAERHARELSREKERVDRLLLNIMPRTVYEEMKHYGMVTPQRFDHASVLLLDFVGFTDMAIAHSPGPIVAELNDIFTSFDRIVERFGCERIKTIGDAYMAVAGLPEPNPDHAQALARVALRMKRYIDRRNKVHPEAWRCRIGIGVGPVVGSILGVQKYVYDIFGPGVNLAARMEQMSEPMQITISEPSYLLLRDHFVCTERGTVDVKGFGPTKLYTLDSEQTVDHH
ncbi:MAG: adenylate/guanylate cyclase domain-containing protein [Pseudolabrys sp.]|nr:adenylate/guanylate cyclase domain-containing protein [Pseudolabrys sp.]